MEIQKCYNELDRPITCSEISKAISKLKSGKSPGLDKISNNMLKYGQLFLLPCLEKLFNACLANGKYPHIWASGYVIPIHKANDRSDPSNYRGITVTSAIGKLFNSVLNKRLDTFLIDNSIINDFQIGFTKEARTTDHMFILKTIIDKYCNVKEGKVFACFVDFQKAFDTVIHTGIKIKLLQAGVGTMFYNTIKTMYEISQSCIKINNKVTDYFPIQLGVKQGDNLSPNLFKMFINDLPAYLTDCIDPISLQDKHIPCLMYADDLILLSTSHEGLQSRLNQLNIFCRNWCLNVNHSKTKVLIFNKAGRHISQRFVYDNHTIECVSRYKYLGVYFCASGSFSVAKDELYKKALKAFFKLKRDLLSLGPSIHTSLHVFDHTIKPILLYGCEIWGSFNILSAKFRNGNPQIDSIYKNLQCEKLHIRFCKSILGVNNKATNFAVLSELGRFPLSYNVILSMLNYWHRLHSLDSMFPLLKAAYDNSKALYLSQKPSWYGSIDSLSNNLSEVKQICTQGLGIQAIKNKLKSILRSHYIILWRKEYQNNVDGKLRTFIKFKTCFGLENYLSILKTPQQRKFLTKLRISCNNLKIESGRHKKMPLELRTCSQCTSGEIENEIHFLFNCIKHSSERDTMMSVVRQFCPLFDRLNDDDKLIWLMNTETKEILLAVSKYIRSCMP